MKYTKDFTPADEGAGKQFLHFTYSEEVLIESGLIEDRINEDGDMEYIGTIKQFQKAEALQKELDQKEQEK